MDIEKYWEYTISQNAEKMRGFFHEDAHIQFHNTNERFSLEEFISVNCEYPGTWKGKIERIERSGDLIITVCHIMSMDDRTSCHVTSFISLEDDKIISIDEYWGDDGIAPKWRLDKKLGQPIVPKASL